jgi:hypothetical protein
MMLSKKTKILLSHFYHVLFLIFVGWCICTIVEKYKIFDSIVSIDKDVFVLNMRAMSSTVAQIAAALVGLILAALAMLLSMSNHSLIVNMGVSGHLHLLVGRMLISMVLFMVVAIFGLVLMVKVDVGVVDINRLFVMGCIAATSLLEVFRKISRVLWSLSPLTDDDTNVVKTYYENK